MNRLHLFTGLGLAALVLVSGLVGVARADGPEIGAKAPDFTLTDVNGKTVKLSDYQGKIVVLEWTNPNCPFVQRHYREQLMQPVQKAYTDKGVVWLVINSTNEGHNDYESPETLKSIYAEWGGAFTDLLMDTKGTIGKAYEAKTTPHMFVIDSKGVLVYQGAIDDDPRGGKERREGYVQEALDALMAGKDIATTTTKPYGCSVKY